MRKSLRIAAAAILAVTLLWWAASGCNTGWTKTSVSTMETDPITGIEYPVWKKQFVPGLDLCAAGTGCAALLIGLSFLPLFSPNTKNQNP